MSGARLTRRVTVEGGKKLPDTPPGSSSGGGGSSSAPGQRRLSVFERLGPGAVDRSKPRDSYPMERCRNWLREGRCQFGPNCKFLHGPFTDPSKRTKTVRSVISKDRLADKEEGQHHLRTRSVDSTEAADEDELQRAAVTKKKKHKEGNQPKKANKRHRAEPNELDEDKEDEERKRKRKTKQKHDISPMVITKPRSPLEEEADWPDWDQDEYEAGRERGNGSELEWEEQGELDFQRQLELEKRRQDLQRQLAQMDEEERPHDEPEVTGGRGSSHKKERDGSEPRPVPVVHSRLHPEAGSPAADEATPGAAHKKKKKKADPDAKKAKHKSPASSKKRKSPRQGASSVETEAGETGEATMTKGKPHKAEDPQEEGGRDRTAKKVTKSHDKVKEGRGADQSPPATSDLARGKARTPPRDEYGDEAAERSAHEERKSKTKRRVVVSPHESHREPGGEGMRRVRTDEAGAAARRATREAQEAAEDPVKHRRERSEKGRKGAAGEGRGRQEQEDTRHVEETESRSRRRHVEAEQSKGPPRTPSPVQAGAEGARTPPATEEQDARRHPGEDARGSKHGPRTPPGEPSFEGERYVREEGRSRGERGSPTRQGLKGPRTPPDSERYHSPRDVPRWAKDDGEEFRDDHVAADRRGDHRGERERERGRPSGANDSRERSRAESDPRERSRAESDSRERSRAESDSRERSRAEADPRERSRAEADPRERSRAEADPRERSRAEADPRERSRAEADLRERSRAESDPRRRGRESDPHPKARAHEGRPREDSRDVEYQHRHDEREDDHQRARTRAEPRGDDYHRRRDEREDEFSRVRGRDERDVGHDRGRTRDFARRPLDGGAERRWDGRDRDVRFPQQMDSRGRERSGDRMRDRDARHTPQGADFHRRPSSPPPPPGGRRSPPHGMPRGRGRSGQPRFEERRRSPSPGRRDDGYRGPPRDASYGRDMSRGYPGPGDRRPMDNRRRGSPPPRQHLERDRGQRTRELPGDRGRVRNHPDNRPRPPGDRFRDASWERRPEREHPRDRGRPHEEPRDRDRKSHGEHSPARGHRHAEEKKQGSPARAPSPPRENRTPQEQERESGDKNVEREGQSADEESDYDDSGDKQARKRPRDQPSPVSSSDSVVVAKKARSLSPDIQPKDEPEGEEVEEKAPETPEATQPAPGKVAKKTKKKKEAKVEEEGAAGTTADDQSGLAEPPTGGEPGDKTEKKPKKEKGKTKKKKKAATAPAVVGAAEEPTKVTEATDETPPKVAEEQSPSLEGEVMERAAKKRKHGADGEEVKDKEGVKAGKKKKKKKHQQEVVFQPWADVQEREAEERRRIAGEGQQPKPDEATAAETTAPQTGDGVATATTAKRDDEVFSDWSDDDSPLGGEGWLNESSTETAGADKAAAPAQVPGFDDVYDPISDDELDAMLEDEDAQDWVGADKAPAPLSVEEVDWSALVTSQSSAGKTEVHEPGAHLKRFSPGHVFARVGISPSLAGPRLTKLVQQACVDAGTAALDIADSSDSNVAKDTSDEMLARKNAGALVAAAATRRREKEALFSDVGPCRRALCARRDLAIRKKLRRVSSKFAAKLHVFSATPTAPMDADLFLMSVALYKHEAPGADAKLLPSKVGAVLAST